MAARRNRKNTEAETENTAEATEPTEAEATITEPTTEATDTEPATETPATEAEMTIEPTAAERIDTAALIAQAEAEATEQRDHTQSDYDKIARMYTNLVGDGTDHIGQQKLDLPDYDETEYLALRKWGRAMVSLNTASQNVSAWIDQSGIHEGAGCGW